MSATERPLSTQPGYSPSETSTDSADKGPLRKAQAIIVGLSLLFQHRMLH